MQKLFFSCILIVILPLVCISQHRIDVKGLVMSVGGFPVSDAVILIRGDKYSYNIITKNDGSYTLDNIETGKYSLMVHRLGYDGYSGEITLTESPTRIPTIYLEEGIDIDSVVVISSRPLITSLPDRIIYNVELDSTAINSTTHNLLQRLPFIRQDPDKEELTVMGGSDYVITVDGKKSVFLSESNQYVAKLLKGNKLKQIELITNPDGRYSDKTAVINIVTKEDLPNGIAGSIAVHGTTFGLWAHSGITVKAGRFAANVQYRPRYYDNPSKDYEEDINYFDAATTDTKKIYNTRYKENNHQVTLNASLDISDLDLLTFSGSFHRKNNADMSAGTFYSAADNLNPIEQYTYSTGSDIFGNRTTGTASYQRSFEQRPGRLFTATYGYEQDFTKNELSGDVLYISDGQRNISANFNEPKLREHTIGVDFYDPITSRATWFITAKYINRRYNSTESEAGAVNKTLDYTQQVVSVAPSFSYRNNKFFLNASLHLEKTINNIIYLESDGTLNKNYFDVMPRIVVNYRAGKSSAFTLSYMVPSFRPDIRYLNPYLNTSDPNHYYTGNPDLKPEKKHRLLLNYRFNSESWEFILRNVLTKSSNSIFRYTYTNSDGIITTSYDNIGNAISYDIFFEVTYYPASFLELNGEVTATYTNYRYNNRSYTLWSCDMDSYAKFSLWKDTYLYGGFWLFPLSTSLQSTRFHYYTGYTIRVGQNFKDDRIRLSLDLQNVFHKNLTGIYEITSDTYYSYNKERFRGRTVTLSLQYSFGKLKENVSVGRRMIRNTDREKN